MTGFRWWLLQVEYCCLFLIFSCGRNWAREAFQGPFYKGTNSSWPNHLPFLISIGLLGRYNQSTTPPIEMTFFSLDFLEMRLFWELSIKLPLNAFSCLSPSRATQPDYRTWASGDPSVWLGEMGTCVLILFLFFPISGPLNVRLCMHTSQRFISVLRMLKWKLRGALTTSQMLPRL